MFDKYKTLMGKKEQQENESSIISKSFDLILKPYKTLFRRTNKKPKEINMENKTSIEKKTEILDEAKPIIKQKKLRAGKVLWKKK